MFGELESRIQPVALIESAFRALGEVPGVRRIGFVRIPLAGPYRPKATLYRLPDGSLIWCLRLWNVDHAEPRCASTSAMRSFARRARLPELARQIEELVATSRPVE